MLFVMRSPLKCALFIDSLRIENILRNKWFEFFVPDLPVAVVVVSD